MGLIAEARAAWQRYLAIDPSSKWADEARAHLAELPAVTKSSRFDRVRPMIESAAARGDAAAVRSLLADHLAYARSLAEVEYLGRWGEAAQKGDDVAAARWLAVARGIAEACGTNDTLLHDSIDVIDRTPRREAIAAAYASY